MFDRVGMGSKLRAHRTLKGKTLLEVSEELGIAISSLASYEAGERIPRDELKVKIAKYYDDTVQSIFFAD